MSDTTPVTEVGTPAAPVTTPIPTPNYDDNREYKSLKKKVEQMFQKVKTDWYVEDKYKGLKSDFMASHNLDDATRRQATALLEHLHTHVYEDLMALRTAKKQMVLQEKAAENVKAALETITREDSYHTHLNAQTKERLKINADYAEKKGQLDREYKAAMAKLNEQEDVVMVRKALDTVYATQSTLRRYYWRLSQAEQTAYIKALDAELESASKPNKQRVRNILM